MELKEIKEGKAYVAVTPGGFVDGACFTESEDTAAWISDMKRQGICVVLASRTTAKDLLFTELSSGTTHSDFARMIVARRENGEVEAAGWDVAETRQDAQEWLKRGLALEFVSREQVGRLSTISPAHVFATITPAGEALSSKHASSMLKGF